MSRSLTALLALMPSGRAWTRAVGTRMHRLLEAIAQEFDRVETRTVDLMAESAPDEATEMLPDWEDVTRATACSSGGSLDVRRRAVIERLRGGVPTYPALEQLLTDLGYTTAFTAWAPFTAGGSVTGDALSNDEWQHAVGIYHEPSDTPSNDDAMRCTVEDLLHIHTVPVWPNWLELSGIGPIELSGIGPIQFGAIVLDTPTTTGPEAP